MATFGQWVSGIQKGSPKRVTWVCGSEPDLREEVVEGIKRVGGFSEVLRRVIGEDSESSIWDDVNQYGFDPAGKRLILIRGAEKISNWEPLRTWMADSRRMPNTFILLVAEEARLRHQPTEDGKKEILATPLDFILNRGAMVEARTPNEDDTAAWIRWRTGTDMSTGLRLIRRCGGDVPRIANVVRMIAPLGIPLTPNLVDLLAEPVSSPDFVHNLLIMDKKAALGSLPEGSELLWAIGELDYRLDVLAALNPLLLRQAPIRDIADEGRVKVHLARTYLPHAKHYNAAAVRRRREVLASIDEVAQRSGPVVGLGESLVALW